MDICRQFPIRYFGYGYVFGELLYLKSDEDTPSDFYAITLFYMAGHAIYKTALAAMAVSQPSQQATLPQGLMYVFLTPIETLVWDCLTSVLMPYLVSTTTLWVFDYGVFGGLEHNHAVRKFVPPFLAFLSIPIFGPLIDLTGDYILDLALGPGRWNMWKY